MLVEQVADIITPLIAAVAGQPNFASLTFTIHRYLQNLAIGIAADLLQPRS